METQPLHSPEKRASRIISPSQQFFDYIASRDRFEIDLQSLLDEEGKIRFNMVSDATPVQFQGSEWMSFTILTKEKEPRRYLYAESDRKLLPDAKGSHSFQILNIFGQEYFESRLHNTRLLDGDGKPAPFLPHAVTRIIGTTTMRRSNKKFLLFNMNGTEHAVDEEGNLIVWSQYSEDLPAVSMIRGSLLQVLEGGNTAKEKSKPNGAHRNWSVLEGGKTE